MFTPEKLNELKQLIKTKKNILILAHQNPDGDAIGSSLGLYHFLRTLGVQSTIIVPNEFPKFLKWLPEAKNIIIGEYRVKFVEIAFRNADLIFCLDFNTSSRINQLETKLNESKAVKVLIDHHQNPDNFDYIYSDTSQPATCQMIYKFIDALGEVSKIDEKIATCLYTGILTDTGSFRFKNTTAETHKIISVFLEKGAKPDLIASNIFDCNTPERLKLLGCVLESIELIPNKNTAILYVTRNQLLELGYQKGDTEGFVNYGLSIVGIKFVAFFMEDLQNDFVKISFRSKGNFDVNAFSRSYFNGGGHINAAGGRSDLSLKDSISRFKNIIENEIHEIS
ncbi:bifunctional oligoribonuclease/PAP phosphatase NrnA [Apibacter sp. wkB309]|uniref:DHH family phosphoesterase n=1 Tax=Apibacter sp. wkB309 TaxID=1679467 RepID=UPI000CF91C1F|nr:bifunctional oligoribonuclease/PAP phosphatase NrnA [Apibacter sp. wkB309]PQL91477.1 DHH family phosphoesterase [Apibacter sp. wkB309]